MLLSPPLMAIEALPFSSSDATAFGPSLSPPLTGLKRSSAFAKASKPKRAIDFSRFEAVRAASSALHHITAGLPSPPQQVLELKMPSPKKNKAAPRQAPPQNSPPPAANKRARDDSHDDDEESAPPAKRSNQYTTVTANVSCINNSFCNNTTVNTNTTTPTINNINIFNATGSAPSTPTGPALPETIPRGLSKEQMEEQLNSETSSVESGSTKSSQTLVPSQSSEGDLPASRWDERKVDFALGCLDAAQKNFRDGIWNQMRPEDKNGLTPEEGERIFSEYFDQAALSYARVQGYDASMTVSPSPSDTTSTATEGREEEEETKRENEKEHGSL